MFKRFRSQIDYGIFLPVQAGAVAALKSDDAAVQEPVQKISGKKRCTVRRTSRDWVEHSRQRGNYVCMGPLPDGYTNSNEFVMELMEKTGVICTPKQFWKPW